MTEPTTCIIASPTVASFRDHPIPGAIEVPCHLCPTMLHVAPSSMTEAEHYDQVIHVCPAHAEMVAMVDAGETTWRRAAGADEEMDAAGLSRIAMTDQIMTNDWNAVGEALRAATAQPGLGYDIDRLLAYVSSDDTGEGIVAVKGVPLIGADMDRMLSLRPVAERIAKETGRTIKLVRFDQRTEVEIIDPEG